MYKVVLADDETIALEGLLTLTDWEELGFQICGACENGEEALAAIVEHTPDLVITDIRMPEIDGLELIRLNLRDAQEQTGGDLPVGQPLRNGADDRLLGRR